MGDRYRRLNVTIFAAALLLLGGAAQSAVWQWSKTAGSNAGADPSINWAEGQSPGSVNDSARALMARFAEYRDDISGVLATAGSSTAYTLTTNQGLGNPPVDGQLIAFTPHATNGAAATLAVDGGTARPFQTAPGVAVASATLISGTPYSAKYSVADSAWILRHVYAATNAVPIGGLVPFVGSSAPSSNFALANGVAISRSTYAALFALVGTTYGAGDGTTTFNLPNLQGRTISGPDPGGVVMSSAALGVTANVGAVGGAGLHSISVAEMPSHFHANTLSNPTHVHIIGSVTSVTQGGGAAASVLQPSGTSALTGASTSDVVITNASTGSGTAMSLVQPTIILSYLIRIL